MDSTLNEHVWLFDSCFVLLELALGIEAMAGSYKYSVDIIINKSYNPATSGIIIIIIIIIILFVYI